MKAAFAAFGLLLTALAPAAFATPAPATKAAPAGAERRALLAALRPRIEARLGGPVAFVVSQIKVEAGWALVVAEPQRPGGGRIDGRRYFRNFDDMDGITVSAILRLRGRRWTLVDQRIGATDVWYCGMSGPPRSLTGC